MSGNEEYIKNNVEESRKAIEASRINKRGLTDRKMKLNSKNFDKLMKQRGLSSKSMETLKQSCAQMQVRHAKAGEKFVTTHGSERSSGVYVSEKSLGKTSGERINIGALPHSNSAEYETTVELTRDQNLVYGKIAPQSKFSKMDPKQQPREGGGEQVITDGGYSLGAIRNKDTKYPVPVKQTFLQRANEHRAKNEINSNNSRKRNIRSYTQFSGQNR